MCRSRACIVWGLVARRCRLPGIFLCPVFEYQGRAEKFLKIGLLFTESKPGEMRCSARRSGCAAPYMARECREKNAEQIGSTCTKKEAQPFGWTSLSEVADIVHKNDGQP